MTYRKAEKKRAKELLVQEQAANDAELWDVQFRTLEETKNDFRYVVVKWLQVMVNFIL